MKELSIYIHIPFCDHKCIYCDFYSIIDYKNVESYKNSIKLEIQHFAKKYSEGRKVISIFFGGGTPSFMSDDYISEILREIESNFLIAENAEITLETNPGTVDLQKLIAFRKVGINRISIGIQSFDENELKFLTRIHDSKTAIETVQNSQKAGFENISIGLIFNLPNQTKTIWENNLLNAINLPINHISAYSLILEKGTILNKMVLDGKVSLQDDNFDADLYEFTIDYLTKNNFLQYEVSNFAKPGFECAHNNAYWHYKEYLSFGTSAHSFMEGNRWWNYKSLSQYLLAIQKKNNAISSQEILSEQNKFDEYLMLSLRSSGIILSEFRELFGNSWLEKNQSYFNALEKEKFIIIDNEKIKFTAKGYSLCDEITAKLLSK